MKKDQVVILEKRGVILVSGEDSKDFLQNIITNDINKVSNKNSIFSAEKIEFLLETLFMSFVIIFCRKSLESSPLTKITPLFSKITT